MLVADLDAEPVRGVDGRRPPTPTSYKPHQSADLPREDQLTGPTYDTSVLVVGAGPVGAVLALELAHHGVPSILIDRADGPSTHPKMDYLNGRSMELLRRLGLTDAIRARGIDPGYSADFLWSAGFDQPPVHVWRHPSVECMRERFAHVNDGTAPVEVYQRLPGSVLEEVAEVVSKLKVPAPLIAMAAAHES